MRVTTWTEYSLLIALHLARRGQDASAPVAARDLAEAERLPADYVEQILLRLRRADLVKSVRGARGGYLLARDPATITVRDVMTASEHQTFEVNCESRSMDMDRCRSLSSCAIRPVWLALQRRVDDLLSSITLADLLKEKPTSELVLLTAER